MAKDDDDELDLDTAPRRSGGGMKMIIVMVIIALLVSASIIATLYFTGTLSGGAGAEETETAQQDEDESTPAAKGPAVYIDLSPAFIVNFPEDGVAEYLQIEMQALARDKRVADVMTAHMPVIRNDIVLLLSSQKYSELKSRAGKQRLQKEVLQTVQKVVREGMREKLSAKEGEKVDPASLPNVENIFFTSFIMQ